MDAILILAFGITIVIGLIIIFRINAFVALIAAAMAVSLMTKDDDWSTKISRVAEAFGTTAGKIGIVIAFAAVIGKCMMDSGAADRIVRSFMSILGEKRAPFALMGSGFVLAVPVFFDTVFYLLVPLARSLYRSTKKNYLLYLLAIGGGGAITHTLVPPTPGPLVMASTLNIDIGTMILVGALVALPAALASIIYAEICNRIMPIPMRELGPEHEEDQVVLKDNQLPSLFLSLLPIVLPVLMIASNTIVSHLAKQESTGTDWKTLSTYTAVFGDANFALFVSMVIALMLYLQQRRPTLAKMGEMMEDALMSGGVIILITAGGGAFGAMLKQAKVGDAIMGYFAMEGSGTIGMTMLLMGFFIAALLKIAQGSSTVAMITTSGMMASLLEGATNLPFHPVYLATSIGAGSLIGSWMNDSGFWIFAKMGGLTEVEALKAWTPLLIVLGLVSLGMTLVLATVLPFPLG